MSSEIVQYWSVTGFEGLSARLLHDVLRLRVDVFVVEQNCPYPEIDGLDLDAIHIVGQLADDTVIAYCRILPPQGDGLPHIGRVVVPTGYRGKDLGKELMQKALQVLHLNYGSKRSALAAQAHLQKFYMEFGYSVTGPEYLLDGIPHVDMMLGED